MPYIWGQASKCPVKMTYGCGGGLVAKSCLTLASPWTVARQAPLSMGFSRQEYWSGLPFPSPRMIYISKYKFHKMVQFSCLVMSNSLWPHGLQHTRPPYPSPAPGIYSNSCPLSQWCHPTISSSVIPFSFLQFFPASGYFPMSQFFISGDQSIGVSASTSVLSMNIQD